MPPASHGEAEELLALYRSVLSGTLESLQEVRVFVWQLCRLACVLAVLATPVLLTGCAPQNIPPEITSLQSRSRVIAPGDSVLVECIAFDQDGDELTYTWSSDRGTINGQLGVVAWTAPVQEGLGRISVVVSDGGEVTATQSTTIIVKSNTPPVVKGVTAEIDWVRPGETATVRCEAEDLDNDALTYVWSADCGEIQGQSATATWTAPESEGECRITVVVDDGYDGRATASMAIVSSQHEPLMVTSVMVTALDDPFYLEERSDWYKVYWQDSYVIECTVTEPERIASYEWSDGAVVASFPVGAGRIVFEGGPSKIRWTAPKERGEVTMTVTVRDNAGNEASRSFTLMVESCTCAFKSTDSESESKE